MVLKGIKSILREGEKKGCVVRCSVWGKCEVEICQKHTSQIHDSLNNMFHFLLHVISPPFTLLSSPPP